MAMGTICKCMFPSAAQLWWDFQRRAAMALLLPPPACSQHFSACLTSLTTSLCCVVGTNQRLQPWLKCTSCPWLVAHFLSSSSSSYNLALLLCECIHMQVAFACIRMQAAAAVAWLLQLQAWPSASCTCFSSTRDCSVLQHPLPCQIRPPLAISTLVMPAPTSAPFPFLIP